MPLMFALRDGDHFAVATDDALCGDRLVYPKSFDYSCSLFRVNDVLICWHGSKLVLDELRTAINWKKIKGPLKESDLAEFFFLPLSQAVLNHKLIEPSSDGSLPNYGANVIFLCGQTGYLFKKGAFYRIDRFALSGDGEEPACGAFDYYEDKASAETIVVEGIRSAMPFSSEVVYPILLARSDQDTLQIIEEDGNRSERKIPTLEIKGGKKR
jgi:hypothetical protein